MKQITRRSFFGGAAAGQSKGYAMDWLSETTPMKWNFRAGPRGPVETRKYDWFTDEGALPYPV